MNPAFLRISALDYRKTLLIGLVLGALYFFFVFDTGANLDQQIAKENETLEVEEQKRKEAERAKKQAEKLKQEVVLLSEQYKTISAQIPSDLKIPEILKVINSMAGAAGVGVKETRPQKANQKDILEETPIQVVAEGNFGELTLFLYNMVNTERVTKIVEFSVSRPQSSSGMRETRRRPLVLDVVFGNYRFIGDAKVEGAEVK